MQYSTIESALRAIALSLTAAFLMTACGGGADTVTNDPTTATPGAGYTGAPPANEDAQLFRIALWEKVRTTDRCGNCHGTGGQAPTFARSDDVNLAYQAATALVDRNTPSQSLLVTKVGGGHNCWVSDPGACAAILTGWISDWVGQGSGGELEIELLPPPPYDPGSSRRFPAAAPSAFAQLHGLLQANCASCHRADAAAAQMPYFGSTNVAEAYQASIPRINLDTPEDSRFVVRLRDQGHNCWSASCASDAAALQTAIEAMVVEIGDPVPLDPNLLVSKATTLEQGTVASRGNRYDAHVIALYEFQTMAGSTAFDTSGVDPAADLQLSGDVKWVGGWGINITSGKAQATTTASRKFQQLITQTGEYSLEAWVIPGNTTQEDARIISYSGSTSARNFTLGQTLYNYDVLNRSTTTDGNGMPALSTADADQRLQASLQHVVATFDPVNGRRLYVNGEFTGDLDPAGGGTLGDWDTSFAFVLGNEVSNNRQWQGVIRLVAVHNRALTPEQVQQNFVVGVGQKYFLLFGVEHLTDVPRSYIVFEAAEYDSAGYLFTHPKFISLDPSAAPSNIPLRGMRIGVNGAEPLVGQAYRLLDVTLGSDYSAASGQTLSTVGTIIGVEQGPSRDEFFLCFDQIGARSNVCSTFAAAVPPATTYRDRPSDIGVRTFDAINATMASITGVDPNTTAVRNTFINVRQSLPAVNDIQAFVSSHQTSIAQLSLQYCKVLVETPSASNAFFGQPLPATFNTPGERNVVIDPLVAKAIGDVSSQPAQADVSNELDDLINRLCAARACTGARVQEVTIAACGAALGNAATLIQ